MKNKDEKTILEIFGKNHSGKKYFLAFFLVSIFCLSLGIIIESRRFPDAIKVEEISDSNQYVECTVIGITDSIANYSENGIIKDEYYLATDGINVYILNLSASQYNLICNYLNDEAASSLIYGMSEEIPQDLKEVAVDIYNQLYQTDEVTIDNFNNYLVPYLINLKANPNSSAQILRGIGILSGIIAIIFGIYCIFAMLKNRKNVKKFNNEYGLNLIIEQLNDSTNIEFKKSKVLFLKDYIISYSSIINIIKYDDIVWMYPYDFRVYGIVTNKRIIIITKDKKQYVLANAFAFGKKNKEQYEKCMEEIVKRRPNILVGYTPENIVAMNDENFKDTINSVTKK